MAVCVHSTSVCACACVWVCTHEPPKGCPGHGHEAAGLCRCHRCRCCRCRCPGAGLTRGVLQRGAGSPPGEGRPVPGVVGHRRAVRPLPAAALRGDRAVLGPPGTPRIPSLGASRGCLGARRGGSGPFPGAVLTRRGRWRPIQTSSSSSSSLASPEREKSRSATACSSSSLCTEARWVLEPKRRQKACSREGSVSLAPTSPGGGRWEQRRGCGDAGTLAPGTAALAHGTGATAVSPGPVREGSPWRGSPSWGGPGVL